MHQSWDWTGSTLSLGDQSFLRSSKSIPKILAGAGPLTGLRLVCRILLAAYCWWPTGHCWLRVARIWDSRKPHMRSAGILPKQVGAPGGTNLVPYTLSWTLPGSSDSERE